MTLWAFDIAWGTQGNGNGQFQSGSQITVKANGNVLVADDLRNDYQEFDKDGNWIRTSPGGSGQLSDPTGTICVSPLNGDIFVGDLTGTRIKQFQSDSTWIRTFGTVGTGNGQFKRIDRICCDSSGRLYVKDGGTGRKDVQRFTSAGVFDSIFHAATIIGMAYKPDSDLIFLLVGAINPHVISYDTTGAQVTDYGVSGPPYLPTNRFSSVPPYESYVTDVSQFDTLEASGLTITGSYGSNGAGNGQFATSDPIDLCPSPDGQYLYLADHNNYRVQRWLANVPPDDPGNTWIALGGRGAA